MTGIRRSREHLLDTDVLIGILRRWDNLPVLLAPEFRPLYSSSLSRRELFRKRGLSNAEKLAIRQLLSSLRVLYPDHEILECFNGLLVRYADRVQPGWDVDMLIAATAWGRRLPLVTMNLAHYRFIREIEVLPPQDVLM